MLKRATPTLLAALLAILASSGCSEQDAVSPSEGQQDLQASSGFTAEDGASHVVPELLVRANDSVPNDPGSADAQSSKGNSGAARVLARFAADSGRGGYQEHQIDPVKANGAIFENWPKPAASIVISGLQEGYIEPCGCAGLENQKGGLARKHTLVKQLAADGWKPISIDLGGFVKRFDKQQEIKYHSMIDALKSIGYQAIAFGPDDLRLPVETIYAAAAAVDEDQPPFVSANVTVLGDDELLPRFKVLQVAGKKIGVTSIVGKSYSDKVPGQGIDLADPVQSLKSVMPKLLAAKCDMLILLSHAPKKESEELAKTFPQFHFVVTAGGAEEPPREAVQVAGTNVRLIEVGHKGMYAAVLGLYDEPKRQVRYQRVPLDHRFKDAPEMVEVMASYQEQLKDLGFRDLGLRPQPHPSGNSFVGSAKCSECHTSAHDVWADTPHSHATETLIKQEVPRHYDPECLSCHATGWNPQKYFPYESGYLSLKQTPHLTANGCENCHGPGSAHVAAESGEIAADDAKLNLLRKQMRVAKHADSCLACHDLDNSPDFNKEGGFEKYWPEVEHLGTD